uniref:BMA-NPP-19, isoform i n=1 Tax=Brugia malayi TaxID=6279 RepID=A0A1U7EZX6_BRUMA|nr:BMA-NPP-19, isoform i [Brugia malayi]
MIADSEVSLFSDSSRLSSSNTHSQHSAPSFLFGSHSRRRSLIMSFDDSSEKRTTEQDTLTSSSKSSSQTNKSVHWSPALTQTKNTSLGGLYEDFHMDTDLDKLSSVGSDVPVV